MGVSGWTGIWVGVLVGVEVGGTAVGVGEAVGRFVGVGVFVTLGVGVFVRCVGVPVGTGFREIDAPVETMSNGLLSIPTI